MPLRLPVLDSDGALGGGRILAAHWLTQASLERFRLATKRSLVLKTYILKCLTCERTKKLISVSCKDERDETISAKSSRTFVCPECVAKSIIKNDHEKKEKSKPGQDMTLFEYHKKQN
jgi:hypothetical protein